jgi:DNA polymerase III delta prime subunit
LQAQLEKLQFIARNEGVTMHEKQLQALLERGDLRQSINSLQSFKSLKIIPEQLLPISDGFGEDLLVKLGLCTDVREVYQIGL